MGTGGPCNGSRMAHQEDEDALGDLQRGRSADLAEPGAGEETCFMP